MFEIILVTRRLDLHEGQIFELGEGHHAIWILSGELKGDGAHLTGRNGIYAQPNAKFECQKTATAVHFSLVKDANDLSGLSNEIITVSEPSALFRLDMVSFPRGAVAYRHVHAGPGTRFLLEGGLKVATDHGVTVMKTGDAWFEDANSPVRATASETLATSFIRATILPVEYLGKPSISYLDAEDDDKPRLQTNTRFFDQVIDLREL